MSDRRFSELAACGEFFRLVYADPPWKFRDSASAGKRGAVHKYPVMDTREICRLPVPEICERDAVLALWWVGAMPGDALDVIHFWGFRLVTLTGLVWMKRTKTGRPHVGMGHWTRAGSECCAIAVRGRPPRACAGVQQVIEAPIREHSRKPDEARDRLVMLCGDVPRIELFARQRADGWQSWGNEL